MIQLTIVSGGSILIQFQKYCENSGFNVFKQLSSLMCVRLRFCSIIFFNFIIFRLAGDARPQNLLKIHILIGTILAFPVALLIHLKILAQNNCYLIFSYII